MNYAALALNVAAIMFGWYVTGAHRERVFRGRIFTAPLVRLLGWHGLLVRLLQILFCTFLLTPAPDTAYYIAAAAVWFSLFADDLLTGDDDRWKRWKSKARNAVKWRMKLPALSREPSAA